jgi:hypothetical protein
MTAIVAFVIERQEARYAEIQAHTESVVRVSFFDAHRRRIASRIVLIPPDVELSDSEVWKAANVTPI